MTCCAVRPAAFAAGYVRQRPSAAVRWQAQSPPQYACMEHWMQESLQVGRCKTDNLAAAELDSSSMQDDMHECAADYVVQHVEAAAGPSGL
jgi:hypothetical protein